MQFTQSRLRERRKKHKKRSQNWTRGFSSCLLGRPTLMLWGCIFLCLPIKLSYNTGPSATSNFCCGKTEPRELHAPPTYMVPWLRFNLAETISAQPPRVKMPSTAEAQLSESFHGGSWTRRKPSAGEVTKIPLCWKPGQQKQTAESSPGSVSDSRDHRFR